MLYMVKVEAVHEKTTNWFFASAETEDEVRAMCEDSESRVVELIDNPSDMADVVRKNYDRLVLLTEV